MAWRPTARDQFHVRPGFASSNLLNNLTPLLFPPWAADLEDDVQSVNGADRNYLLKARCSHRMQWREDHRLILSAGLPDATDYLHTNRYANHEFAHFMWAGLVNGPNVILPSCDPGLGAELRRGDWSLNGLCMRVDREDDREAGFCGAQVALHPQTVPGPGNYRVALGTTGRDFEDATGTRDEQRKLYIRSLDQQLANAFGGFLRIALEAGDATVNARSTWTAGIDAGGELWGRAGANVGFGVGYVAGADRALRDAHGGEACYRAALGRAWALSGHVQCASNTLRSAEDATARVLSLRLTVEL